MKTLYFNGHKVDIQAKKSESPGRHTVTGTKVYVSNVVSALLRYGTYDRYVFPLPLRPFGTIRSREMSEPEKSGRIAYVHDFSLNPLHQASDLILMTPSPGLRPLSDLRLKLSRPRAPMVGVLHSLHTQRSWDTTLLNYLLPLQSYDSMFISSDAGFHVYLQRMNQIKMNLPQVTDSGFIPAEHIRRVPLGIEFDENEVAATSKESARHDFQLKASTVVFLYFGRLSDRSKADLVPLFLVTKQLLDAGHEVELFVAGDDTMGGLEAALRDLASSLGILNSCRILTNISIDKKSELFLAADIFVSPSDSIQETFGISLLEAMAAELPVVASDWSGYRDIVVDGATGFLIPTQFPRFDQDLSHLRGSGSMLEEDILARTTVVVVSLLKEALLRLVVDKDLRRKLGAVGKNRAITKFHWRSIVALYESIWQELLIEAARSTAIIGARTLASPTDEVLFSHYASDSIDASSIVRMASHVDLPYDNGVWKALCQPCEIFTHTLFKLIIDCIKTHGPLNCNKIATILGQDSLISSSYHINKRNMILMHVARLMKYGFLESDLSYLPDSSCDGKAGS
jgi:glycosyltransferase involved in cell wall biosynthesis